MEQRQHSAHRPSLKLPYYTQLQQMPPLDYFKTLRKKFKKARELFWQQVLSGLILDKLFERYGLNLVRQLNCELPMIMLACLQTAINFHWIPRRLRHIIVGPFFSLLFLLYMNYSVSVGLNHHDRLLIILILVTVVLYLLIGFRGSGDLKSDQLNQKTKQIYMVRPYLLTPQTSCDKCKIVRAFRSIHCPICRTCVPKQTRHSVVFGVCIGAGNELLCLLFYYFLYLAQFNLVYQFMTTKSSKLLTQFMFYSVNLIICWQTFVQFLNLLILNFGFGITERQLMSWPTHQYLLKMPQREFVNNCNQGFFNNFINSIMALLGIRGYESEDNQMPNPLQFAPIDPNRSYYINWARAVFYLIPQLPTHKNRQRVQEILQREQPRIIEMYKLQQQFKEQVLSESANQKISPEQFKQRMALKMQAHMMKGMPQITQTLTLQQQAKQLQILAQMKSECFGEIDIVQHIQQLKEDIISNRLRLIDVTVRLGQLQQQITRRKMDHSSESHEGSMIDINEQAVQSLGDQGWLPAEMIGHNQ